ncbi:MAG: PEGA domain-containing protein [Bacteroidota bacterium]
MIRRLAMLMSVPAALLAQIPESSDSSAHLTIISDPAGAEVILDSSLVGQTPIHDLAVFPGLHQLSVASPSFRDWNAIFRNEMIQIGSGETMSLSYEFGTTLNLVTMPSGVNVLYDGRLIGTTPLFYRSSVPLSNMLVLRKDGFRIQEVHPGSIRGIVTMSVVDASVAESEMAIAPSIEKSLPRWAEYTSAAGIVVSGVAAAYFKHRANAHFNTYRLSGSAAALDDTRRFDGYSAVSLVVTQISFGVLAYLLLAGD